MFLRTALIVLPAPNGRSVKMLINATPIPAEAGDVESLVVTMQDLAPLEELERMRAEFLAMVSHELRAPLTSIKGSAATVLDAVPAPDPAAMRQFFRLNSEQSEGVRLGPDDDQVGEAVSVRIKAGGVDTDVPVWANAAGDRRGVLCCSTASTAASTKATTPVTPSRSPLLCRTERPGVPRCQRPDPGLRRHRQRHAYRRAQNERRVG